MTSVCPSGHDSAADDYCDVCGLPIGEGASAPPSAAAPSADGSGSGGAGVSAADAAATAPADDAADCPNCQSANPPNALFCEACGYDFTTGTMPRPVEPSALDLSAFGIPDPSAPTPSGDAPADDPPTAETPAAPAPAAPVPPAPAPAAHESLAPALEDAWVAEVWIDPDWYEEQDSDDALPSAGIPQVVAIRTRSVLVGRSSRSRGIEPEIELGNDNGISRRHCQLTTDGRRWWVEDLGSSNGTYVGGSVGALPAMPITPGEKRELAPDERLYLGAWTRIVVRRAQPGEA